MGSRGQWAERLARRNQWEAVVMTNQSRRTLIVNEYGKRKAARFRARFGLSAFDDSFGAYGDVHDYLHTVIGATISWDDEKRVLAIEFAIECGEVPLPRGLDVAP
jgi:hypothetical protein